MAELTSALDDALSGHGRLVMLAGEPGIGLDVCAEGRTRDQGISPAQKPGLHQYYT